MQEAGGGSHAGAGGGYSGGAPQGSNSPGFNGRGTGAANSSIGGGSGYYTSPSNNIFAFAPNSEIVGGFGGLCWFGTAWYKDVSGHGGKGGAGGNVTYSNMNNIYAYNGNMVTNGTETTADFYEFLVLINDDEVTSVTTENTTGSKLLALTRLDDKKLIPAKIFAQSGVIRETYTTNQGTYTLARVTRTLADSETLPSIASNFEELQVVRATDLQTLTPLNYTNGYMPNQGIGSGAGYLESNNGSFLPISGTN